MAKVKTRGKALAAIATAAKTDVETPKEHGSRSFPGFLGSGDTLIQAIKSFGVSWNPANELLTLANLIVTQKNIQIENDSLNALINPGRVAILARVTSFDLIPVYKTGILSALKSSQNVTSGEILTATNLGKKVVGGRVKAKKNTPVPSTEDAISESELDAIVYHSVSHQEYVIITDSFKTFFTYSTGLAHYKTNEEHLQIEQILEFYDTLPLLNNAADLAISNIALGRQSRNKAFFNDVDGARVVYNQVKEMVKSKYGTKSAEYKLVKGLAFPNLILKKNRLKFN